MIIQSQDITMSAKRNYERKVSASVQTTTQTIGVGQTQGGLSFATDRLGGQTGGFMGTLGYYLDGSSEKVEEMSETASTANRRDEVSTRVQFETLHYLDAGTSDEWRGDGAGADQSTTVVVEKQYAATGDHHGNPL